MLNLFFWLFVIVIIEIFIKINLIKMYVDLNLGLFYIVKDIEFICFWLFVIVDEYFFKNKFYKKLWWFIYVFMINELFNNYYSFYIELL